MPDNERKNLIMNIIRQLIVFILLVVNVLYLSAQESDQLNDSTIKTYVSSLSGIELKVNGPDMQGYSTGSTMSPIFLDFVKEISVAKIASVIFKGGVVIIPRKYDNEVYEPIIYNPLIGNKTRYCNFGLDVGVEPRLYWGIKKRALTGKAKLNSGWFLSFPLEAVAPLEFSYNTIPSGSDMSYFNDYTWFKDWLKIYYNFGPAVGYRHAIFNNWHIEGVFQIMAYNYHIKYSKGYWNGTTEIYPVIKIKAAYVFKGKQSARH